MTPGGDWIMKKSFSGVSAERFRKAYMTGLSAQGKNQLDMEARYRVMNSDKDGLVKSYYQNHETILTDINNKMAKNEADKNELIKKYGPKSPEVMRINQANNDLNLSRQYYNEQMSKPYDQISDNDLVGFIKDNMINDASGAFAYQNKKEELQQNPYAVDRAQMMNNIAEAQAKARIDIAKEMELDRLGLSARKAAKAGAEETLPPGTYVPDASYEKQPGIQSFIDWYGQSSTLAEGEQNSLAIQRFAGDKTIQQTLDRADDENNWPNPVDRRTINETFTSPEMAEQFFWKLKGIVKVIKGKTILKDSSGNDIVVGDSTIVSIRDQNGNVQDMPMKAFLSKPGKALAGMLDIKIKTN
jgi:hypothetical protein